MTVFRWLLVVPGAIVAGMLGSLAGGIAFTIFGSQSLTDAGSAFFGSFALAFVAGLIAPSRRSTTTFVFSCIIVFLALLTFVILVVTNGESFADRSALGKILIPVAQILGALYAIFFLPLIIMPDATIVVLFRIGWWLGGLVIILGILISLVGLLVGLLGQTWVGFTTGLGVLAVGVATWHYPLIHLHLRSKQISRYQNELSMHETIENLKTIDRPTTAVSGNK
jgi:hypothetical protein